MADLSREDLLREEALIRARECAPWTTPENAEDIVSTADAFYAFLNPSS